MNTNSEIEKWVKTWKRADSALSEIKKAELQDPNYYAKNISVLLSMLQYAAIHRIERDTTGLVIQQQRFKKLKKQNPLL
jgi:hypothetical protein